MADGDHDGEGTGLTFKDAADAAWEDAKHKGKQAGWYEVKKIEVRTENPIKEYRVKIKAL